MQAVPFLWQLHLLVSTLPKRRQLKMDKAGIHVGTLFIFEHLYGFAYKYYILRVSFTCEGHYFASRTQAIDRSMTFVLCWSACARRCG